MPPTSDQKLLLAYHRARAAGDAAAAADTWETLVLQSYDRIEGFVAAFRFKGTSQGLPEHERGSALSEVFIRALDMGTDFKKREILAFYGALKTCVYFTCHDYGRDLLKHEIRAEGSFDESYEDSLESGPLDRALAEYDAHLKASAEDAVKRELRGMQEEQLFYWAVARIENDSYREVVELTWRDGLNAQQIADRLGITPENVYQRRRRGKMELERILRGS